MSKSIIKSTTRGMCYICGRFGQTEEHHIFGGRNRKRADADGVTVHLCHWCHNEPPSGVHYNKHNDMKLKRIGQRTWMAHYNKDIADFIRAYGRNYLEVE